MTSVTVHVGDPMAPAAKTLLQASHDLMTSLFPSTTNHQFSVEALSASNVNFYIAQLGAETIGCAALVNKTAYGEIKAMYVSSTARGMGVAARLIERVVKDARAISLPRINLETGIGLNAAHRLYERMGFVDCDSFGDYEADAPYSLYMELAL
ncbi:MAG: GNAT family N-acetyltransferase [Sulfitobacter sp.]